MRPRNKGPLHCHLQGQAPPPGTRRRGLCTAAPRPAPQLAHWRLCLVWVSGCWALFSPNSSRVLYAEDTTHAAPGRAEHLLRWRGSCVSQRRQGCRDLGLLERDTLPHRKAWRRNAWGAAVGEGLEQLDCDPQLGVFPKGQGKWVLLQTTPNNGLFEPQPWSHSLTFWIKTGLQSGRECPPVGWCSARWFRQSPGSCLVSPMRPIGLSAGTREPQEPLEQLCPRS